MTNDEVLHDQYRILPVRSKLIKSVDEGTFTQMKQNAQQQRIGNHNTIEATGGNALPI